MDDRFVPAGQKIPFDVPLPHQLRPELRALRAGDEPVVRVIGEAADG
ncbi:hypothetical protein [Nonomuraea sp. NPDC049400]